MLLQSDEGIIYFDNSLEYRVDDDLSESRGFSKNPT